MANQSEPVEDFVKRFAEEHRHDPLGDVANSFHFENEHVRVWEMDLAPGEASDLHRHDCDYLVILLEGDRVAGVPPVDTGVACQIADVERGKIAFVPKGGTEWAVNIGKRPYREILIELKEQ